MISILYQTLKRMFSQIETLLTDHATACITHANKLACNKRQKSIHGEDIFWGISLYLKHNDFSTIFRKLLGISEDILDEYFHTTYETNERKITTKKGIHLPLNKKFTQELHGHITKKIKKLDLDILFLASFKNLSNQFTTHLYTHNITPETIYENYKKLAKNPMI